MVSKARLTPVDPDQRLRHVDMVRGFALFGVMLVKAVARRVRRLLDDNRVQGPSDPDRNVIKSDPLQKLVVELPQPRMFADVIRDDEGPARSRPGAERAVKAHVV